MGIGERLRSLDDRVLGRPTARRRTYRNIFLLGLVGSVALMVVIFRQVVGALLIAFAGHRLFLSHFEQQR